MVLREFSYRIRGFGEKTTKRGWFCSSIHLKRTTVFREVQEIKEYNVVSCLLSGFSVAQKMKYFLLFPGSKRRMARSSSPTQRWRGSRRVESGSSRRWGTARMRCCRPRGTTSPPRRVQEPGFQQISDKTTKRSAFLPRPSGAATFIQSYEFPVKTGLSLRGETYSNFT